MVLDSTTRNSIEPQLMDATTRNPIEPKLMHASARNSIEPKLTISPPAFASPRISKQNSEAIQAEVPAEIAETASTVSANSHSPGGSSNSPSSQRDMGNLVPSSLPSQTPLTPPLAHTNSSPALVDTPPQEPSTMTGTTHIKFLQRSNTAPAKVATAKWVPSLKKAFSMSFKTTLQRSYDGVNSDLAARVQKFEIQNQDLKVKNKIGQGMRCDVFDGEYLPLGRKVAIKQIRTRYDPDNPEKSSTLLKELEVLASDLHHPNIVEFVGVSLFKEARAVTLVFEYMGGGTLEDFFESRSAEGNLHLVPLAQALNWSIQMFEGLKFLHSKETAIIHRDLKPCNLMLSTDLKTLKLRDFGVSRTVDLGQFILPKRDAKQDIKTDLSQLTKPTAKRYTGTPRYMAPEIEKGSANYTPAVDIYSAALIMWFILEGERPWEKHHGHVAFSVAKTGRRPPLRWDSQQYPDSMAEVIKHCWAHDPATRPGAARVLEVLEGIREAFAPPPASVPCFFMGGARGR